MFSYLAMGLCGENLRRDESLLQQLQKFEGKGAYGLDMGEGVVARI